MSTKRIVKFEIYRYDPDKDERPYMQKLEVELQPTDKMLLMRWCASRTTSTTAWRCAARAVKACAVRTP